MQVEGVQSLGLGVFHLGPVLGGVHACRKIVVTCLRVLTWSDVSCRCFVGRLKVLPVCSPMRECEFLREA